MISKKLSARKLFGRLLKQEIVRKIWGEGIVMIALIFSLPVKMALELSQYSQNISEMPDSVLLDFIVQNEILLALLFCLGAFIALMEFGYLFNRSKVDFYHSLPVSRTMQFLYRYLSGLFLFLVPYVLMYGAAVLVGIAHGALIVGYIKELALFLLIYLLFFCVLYSLSVLAVQLSGSYLSALVNLALLHFIGPFICYLVQEYQNSFYRTWMDTGRPLLFGQGSAITICQKLLEEYMWTGICSGRTLAVLLASAVFLPIAAYLLFLKRPAEKTSCGFAYPVTGPVFCFFAVVSTGMLVGFLLYSMAYSNSTFWLFSGTVAGCVVVHFIMQMILQMNFRAFFQGKLSLVFCTGFAVLLLCVFRYDLTEYDTYLPDVDQIDSVGVSIDDLEYYRNYIKEYTEQEYERMLDRDMVFNMTYDALEESNALAQMNLKNIQPVVRLVSGSIEDEQWKHYENNMQVCFQLRDGRRIFRSYKVDVHENLEDCAEIFAMDRFKEELYPILTRGEENCTVWLNHKSSFVKKKLALTDTRYINLLRTYKRELKDLDFMTLTEEEPLLTLEFTESQDSCFNSYPVYPSFEHTLTLLKGYGYTFEPIEKSIYKIQAMYDKPEEESDGTSARSIEEANLQVWDDDSDTQNTLVIDDKEKLNALSPYLICDSYYSTNLTLQETEPGYYVTGYFLDSTTGEELIEGFLIQKGKVPDFLKKLEEDAK